MIRAIRQLPLVLLAMFLGVSQACACTHDLQGAAAGHEVHDHHAAIPSAHHHAGHIASDEAAELHKDACHTSAPECDHAPDKQAYLGKTKVDVGSKLTHPATGPVTFAPPVQLREARAEIRQTGPPLVDADRRWPSPVTLKVRLLN